LRIDRFVTAENIRLLLAGLLAGGVAAAIVPPWRRAVPWYAVTVAVLGARLLSRRSDWPDHWDGTTTVSLLIVVAGASGARRVARGWTRDGRWVGLALLASSVGVWAGVPETGPAIVVGGVIAGLTLVSGRAGVTPTGAAVLTLAIGWAALAGAIGRPWASVGGALALGALPGLGVARVLPRRWSRPAGPWLLAAHVVLAAIAARWIGVAPNAGWARVAVVLGASMTVGLPARRP
jgi:hypothetical protein